MAVRSINMTGCKITLGADGSVSTQAGGTTWTDADGNTHFLPTTDVIIDGNSVRERTPEEKAEKAQRKVEKAQRKAEEAKRKAEMPQVNNGVIQVVNGERRPMTLDEQARFDAAMNTVNNAVRQISSSGYYTNDQGDVFVGNIINHRILYQ